MVTRYDPESDVLFVRLADAAIVDSEEVRPGIILDYDANGRLVAVEVLDAKTNLAPGGVDLAKLMAA